VDITGITVPITKHNYLVMDVDDLARVVKESFFLASTGRPGPVLIDIPATYSSSKTDFRYPKALTWARTGDRGWASVTDQESDTAHQRSKIAAHSRRTRRRPGEHLRRA